MYMKNGLLNFIIVILSFFVLLFICDKIIVRLEDKMYSTKDNKLNYATYNNDNTEIVILGSSRASHHYVPSILTDSLGMSCVNLGVDGKGILYNYALFHMLVQHNSPRIIIYEFGGFDWEDNGEATYANNEHLAPIYGKYKTTDTLINNVGKNYSTILSILNTYKYNGRLHNVLINTHHIANHNGYQPLYGERKVIEQNEPNNANETIEQIPIHPDKIDYLKRLIKECKERDIMLVFAMSPTMKSIGTTNMEILSEICGDRIPIWDYRKQFNQNELFKDDTHMNDAGAKVYTSQIAVELKRIIAKCEF